MRFSAGVIGVLALFTFADPIGAQVFRDRFVTAVVGLSSSRGGNFQERDTYSADLLVGARVDASAHKAWIVSAVAGGAFRNGSSLTCTFRVPGGPCAPLMPSVGYSGASAGIELGSRVATLMLLAGPALAVTTEQATLALAARVDLSVFVVKRAALVISARNLTIPSLMGMHTKVYGISAGVRLR